MRIFPFLTFFVYLSDENVLVFVSRFFLCVVVCLECVDIVMVCVFVCCLSNAITKQVTDKNAQVLGCLRFQGWIVTRGAIFRSSSRDCL